MDASTAHALRIARDALDSDPAVRADFVTLRCGQDPALHAAVTRLLEEIDAGSDMDGSAFAPRLPKQTGADALIGTSLGPFRVVERIGRGGMGVVYRAEREGADFAQTVAIKLIRRGFDFDDVHARFLRERSILARLSHPQLARFIDGGVAPDGRPWFALEFVQGVSITRWCDQQQLDLPSRVQLFLGVCAAVQYAHTQLIVHRDLKPGNILIDASGAVRLLDFGIARLLDGNDGAGASAATLGSREVLTPEYAAPEQFAIDAPAVVATDVYALGVVLYELLSGVLPYVLDRGDLRLAELTVRETPPQSLAAAIQRPAVANSHAALIDATVATAVWPTPPQARASAGQDRASGELDWDTTRRLGARATRLGAYRRAVRGDLSRIVEKALAKEPQRRYATVEAFAEDLQRWLAGVPVRASGNRWGYRVGKFIGRHRIAVALAASLSLALIGTTGLALYKAQQERIQRDAAIDEAGRATAVREYVMLMFGDAAQRRNGASISARDLLRQGALEIFTRFRDRPADGQAIALSLAELYMQIGDVEGATPLLEGVTSWPGIDANPAVLASAWYDLAQVEYMRGKADHARQLLDRAQAFWRAQPQRFQAVLNESRAMQAQLERAEGRPEQAVATLRQAIAERRAFIGGADREVGAAFNSLALALTQLGRYDEAVQAADEGYRIYLDLGQARSATGLALINNRAIPETYLGRYDSAEADYRLVVDLRRELYGESPELAGAENNLALTLVKEQRYAEATALLEEALRISLAQSGEAGRETMMTRINLAETYAATGRAAEGLALAENAVTTAHAHYGTNTAFIGVAHRSRAKVFDALERPAEARADLDIAVAMFTTLGKGGELYLKALEPLRAKLGTH